MKYRLRNLMVVFALAAVLLAGMILMLPAFAVMRKMWLMLAVFVVIFIGAVMSFWTKRRSFVATLDSESIETMKSQPLANALAPSPNGLLAPPRFNIAHLLVFTFVCAIDVRSFLWGPGLGCWVTLVSQVLFWTVLRVLAVRRVESQSRPIKRPQWFWGVVIISAVTSVGAVVTFLVVVIAQLPVISFVDENFSDTALTVIFWGRCVPVGMIAAGVCLWLTWPRVPCLTLKGDSLPDSSAPTSNLPRK